MDARSEMEKKLKCRAYKSLENPDGRVSLCGEPAQKDENGREFFEIPSHQREDQMKKLISYEFSQVYSVDDPPAKLELEKAEVKRKGRKSNEIMI